MHKGSKFEMTMWFLSASKDILSEKKGTVRGLSGILLSPQFRFFSNRSGWEIPWNNVAAKSIHCFSWAAKIVVKKGEGLEDEQTSAKDQPVVADQSFSLHLTSHRPFCGSSVMLGWSAAASQLVYPEKFSHKWSPSGWHWAQMFKNHSSSISSIRTGQWK